MNIYKESKAETTGTVSRQDLELINGFAKKKLTEEEIFTFEILLCDNDIDRDFERFATEELDKLAELFVGKTGIFDHQWSAKGQIARVYKTEVIEDSTKTTASGETYTYLKAWAYMMRRGNEELIKQIEGGIMREVSVGCSMGKSYCGICGEEAGSSKCGHEPGREYDGKMCCTVLAEAKDAYEWSFVAVPAQKNAGVIKKFGKGDDDLAGWVKNCESKKAKREYNELLKLASMGRRYMDKLREDVVKMGVLSDSGFDGEFLESITKKLDESELLCFKRAFEEKADRLYPMQCQLGIKKSEENSPKVDEFLI